MAHYIKYQTDDGNSLLVEVEDKNHSPKEGVVRAGRLGEQLQETIQEVGTKFEAAMDVINQNVRTIINKIESISVMPSEVEVTFGLKATGEAGVFAVAKITAEANYTIKMKWQQGQDQHSDT